MLRFSDIKKFTLGSLRFQLNKSSNAVKDKEIKKLIIEHKGLKFRLIIDGLLTGLIAGAFSILYRYILSKTESLRLHALNNLSFLNVLLYVLFLLALAFVVKKTLDFSPYSSGSGIPQVEGELLGLFDVNPCKATFSKILGGASANLAGQSLGREGPSIQISAMVAKYIAKLLGRSKIEEKYMISSGAASGLAAAFNAPISAILFSLEEVHKSFNPYLVLPAMLAAIISDMCSKFFFGLKPVFSFAIDAHLPLKSYPSIILTGIFVSLIGICFSKSLLLFQTFYKKLPIHKFSKILLPFLSCIFIAFVLPEIMGGGHHLIDDILNQNRTLIFLIILLIAKLIFTCFCYGSGVQGGIFLPLLVIGALAGLVVNRSLNLIFDYNTYAANFMILGMATMMSVVVRAPLLSIILVSEMTGSFNHFLSLSIVVFIAHIMAEAIHLPPIYEAFLANMKSQENKNYSEKILYDYKIKITSHLVGKALHEIKLPSQSLIISIKRDNYEITPSGQTILQANDDILILTDEASINSLKKELSD